MNGLGVNGKYLFAFDLNIVRKEGIFCLCDVAWDPFLNRTTYTNKKDACLRKRKKNSTWIFRKYAHSLAHKMVDSSIRNVNNINTAFNVGVFFLLYIFNIL